jgi:hypothetical protein
VKVALLVYFASAILLAAGHAALQLVDGLNGWLELAIKLGGALAAMGGAWKWLIGPGYRGGRECFHWVRARLQAIETLDGRLGRIEGRLDEGEVHFQQIDTTLATMVSVEARAVRKSIASGEPVQFTDEGNVERRGL